MSHPVSRCATLDDQAVQVDGALATNGTLTVANATAWETAFTPKVTVYGALLRATRGERISGELLCIGDGSTPNQTFKLKKKPAPPYSYKWQQLKRRAKHA